MFVNIVCHCTYATVMRLFSKSLQEMAVFCDRGDVAETEVVMMLSGMQQYLYGWPSVCNIDNPNPKP